MKVLPVFVLGCGCGLLAPTLIQRVRDWNGRVVLRYEVFAQ